MKYLVDETGERDQTGGIDLVPTNLSNNDVCQPGHACFTKSV